MVDTDLPTHAQLRDALKQVQQTDNGGLGFHMWASVVDRSGIVIAIAYSGASEGDQWPASRLISAQKANTANSLSLDGFALSTANLYAATQPGGSLFGLQASNPVNTSMAYECGSLRHAGRFAYRQSYWRNQRIRRRPCFVQQQRSSRRRARRFGRLFLRRSHHCLESPQCSRVGLRSQRSRSDGVSRQAGR